MHSPDTIFALASGFGKAGIAIVRLSGPASGATLVTLSRKPLPAGRRAVVRELRDPRSDEVIDEALVLWLPGPGSFTGEDQAEFHIHGGIAVRAALLHALSEQPGVRAAEPGEFTRRAFLSGRMDLSAVEGLADLIDAETEAQRRQALRQLQGALADQVADWRDRLVEASALIEAGLDFADEPDIGASTAREALVIAGAVCREVAAELARSGQGERLRDGFTVVIAGPPNAGKSSLLNALARRDVAIVSPYAGTTRDALEVRCDLAGLPVTFVDTAGLREASDPVEREGIARTRERAHEADLVLWLLSPEADGADERQPFAADRVLEVVSKSDLHGRPLPVELAVSAKTGAGLDRLLESVRQAAEQGLVGAGDAIVTRERHRAALRDVASALGRADEAGKAGRDELAAEDMRLALRALGRITGQVDVEDILDKVFAQFCIGK